MAKLSIVIPFYNEERRMPLYFDSYLERLERSGLDYELIAVNDGSTDRTREMLEERARKYPRIRVTSHTHNLGRGAGVRTGVFASHGDYILETDSDGSYDIPEIVRFVQFLDVHPEYDVVIATREHKDTKTVVQQPLIRIVAGKMFHVLFRLFFGDQFSDVMAGLKLYRNAAAQDIFRHQYDNEFLGAAETVYAAMQLGYRITELPVTWHDVRGSKVNVLKAALRTLWGLGKMAIRTMQGKYRRERAYGLARRSLRWIGASARKHWGAAVLAMIVGVVTIAPAIYFRYWSGEYRGIDMFRSDVEANYVSLIQEIYDGHYALGNIYTADGKDAPRVAQQPLSPMIVAGLGKLFDVDAATMNLYTKFFFPALLTLILYALLYSLYPSRSYALLGAIFAMLAPATTSLFFPQAWRTIFMRGDFPASDYQFIYAFRPINPQLSSIFFYSYLLALWSYLFGERKKIVAFFAALILGASFYTYFFVFSFAAVFTALVFIWLLWKKDMRGARAVAAISVVGIIIGIPSALTFFKAAASPLYAEATARVGAYLTHRFIFSRVWFGAMALLILFYRRLTDERWKVFFLIFLLAAFLLTNQQVITGRIIPAPQHYHWYYVAPLAGALFLFFALRILSRVLPQLVSAVTLVLLAVFLYVGVLFQLRSYAIQLPYVREDNRYANILSWITTHVSKDAAVFGNQDFSRLLTAYTPANAYYHAGLTDFLVSTERLKHALFVYTALAGVSLRDAEEYFQEHRNLVGGWLYGEYWRQRNGCSGCFPDEMFNELIHDYQEFLQKDFLKELRAYPLDYAVWDKARDSAWRLERFFSQKLYEDDGIALYAVGT